MMTAGQFFLYLLIIIILKESLASAADSSDLEQPPSTISCCDSPIVSTSELLQTDDGSSEENMGITHGFRLHAQPDSRFVREKQLDCSGLSENLRISGVGQHVEHFIR